jgi:hypothetical protein
VITAVYQRITVFVKRRPSSNAHNTIKLVIVTPAVYPRMNVPVIRRASSTEHITIKLVTVTPAVDQHECVP